MKFIPITWQQFEKDAIRLANQIQKTYGHMDEIVAISRGGIVVARILSDILKADISFITVKSYSSFAQAQEPTITQESPRKFSGEKILLVDELSESGKTFLAALDYVKKLPIASVATACLYVKPQTTYTPDAFVESLDGWVILPYELRETKDALVKEFGEEEAKKKLEELAVLDWSTVS